VLNIQFSPIMFSTTYSLDQRLVLMQALKAIPKTTETSEGEAFKNYTS